MNTCKKVKGSACCGADGSFTFTPYAIGSRSTAKEKMTIRCPHGSLSLCDDTVRVKLTFNLNELPTYPIWESELQSLYKSFILNSIHGI